MNIGFIGLGHLGTPIAENLLAHQQAFYVYNRTAAKAQPLADKGAVICTSVKEVAERCDVVFSVVSDDAALNHITQGEEGIAARLKAGGIHVSMSTIMPATSTSLHALHQQHNSHYVSSPVMGRPEAARARKLNFLVSGESAAIATIRPLLEQAGGAGVWEMGNDPGAAHAAKLCSNFLIIAAVEALAEGIHLAKKSGIDAGRWMEMLTQTIFSSPAYQLYSGLLLKEVYEPAGFSLKLALKDMVLVLQQSQTVQASMPTGEKLQDIMQQAIALGYGDQDIIAMGKVTS